MSERKVKGRGKTDISRMFRQFYQLQKCAYANFLNASFWRSPLTLKNTSKEKRRGSLNEFASPARGIRLTDTQAKETTQNLFFLSSQWNLLTAVIREWAWGFCTQSCWSWSHLSEAQGSIHIPALLLIDPAGVGSLRPNAMDAQLSSSVSGSSSSIGIVILACWRN